jgi:flagellar protein FlaG
MEVSNVQSAGQPARLNPLSESSGAKLADERLKRHAVLQEKKNAGDENESQTNENEVKKIVKEVNSIVEQFSGKVSFSFDPETNRTAIQVIDKETGEVIRQIPPKEMLTLMEKMEEIAGIIYDGRV